MHLGITRKRSSTSKPEDNPPVVPKLERPGPVFPQLQALSFCLSSLSPTPILPQSRPIVPQVQAYLTAVPGLCSRSFRPIFQAYFSPVPAYLSAVTVLSSPSPKPNFPQSCSSFVSQLIWSPHWTTTDAVCFFQVKDSSTSRPVQASSLTSMPTSPQTPWKIDQARAGGRDLFLPLSAFRFGDVADGCFPSPNLTRSVSKTMGVGQKKPSSCSPCCSLLF